MQSGGDRDPRPLLNRARLASALGKKRTSPRPLREEAEENE